MKATLCLIVLAFCFVQLEACPSRASAAEVAVSSPKERSAPGFDPNTQLVDVTGVHAFVPPNLAAGDLRGPCPALNALANHGYLPHNGLATLQQYVNATNLVYGFGLDFGTFLSTYGAVFDGNALASPPEWSMGGVPSNVGLLGSLTGLLGPPQGISNSHDKYEGDGSATRGDLYLTGDDYSAIASQFQALWDLQASAATPNYDIATLLLHHKNRYDYSIANNPYFFVGPFSGLHTVNAGYAFAGQMFANHSADYQSGVMTGDVLKSFFGISGQSGSFVVNQGAEQIPSNWYKRAVGNDYHLPDFEVDLLGFIAKYPELGIVGGNTGTTNSFTGVNLANLTGGVFDAATLTQGNNLQCFVFQAAQQGAPDVLKGLYSDITTPLNMLTSQVTSVLSGLNCPQLTTYDTSQYGKYPGYTQSYNGHPANVGL